MEKENQTKKCYYLLYQSWAIERADLKQDSFCTVVGEHPLQRISTLAKSNPNIVFMPLFWQEIDEEIEKVFSNYMEDTIEQVQFFNQLAHEAKFPTRKPSRKSADNKLVDGEPDSNYVDQD